MPWPEACARNGRWSERAVKRVRDSRRLELVGLHAHIGSQIFELEPYVKAIEVYA